MLHRLPDFASRKLEVISICLNRFPFAFPNAAFFNFVVKSYGRSFLLLGFSCCLTPGFDVIKESSVCLLLDLIEVGVASISIRVTSAVEQIVSRVRDHNILWVSANLVNTAVVVAIPLA